jgi:hypothetical protein
LHRPSVQAWTDDFCRCSTTAVMPGVTMCLLGCFHAGARSSSLTHAGATRIPF